MMASQAGVEPHQMEAQINKVFAADEKQADAVVSKAGVPNDAFWSWAEGQREGELRQAMAELTMQRSSKTLAKLAGEFMKLCPWTWCWVRTSVQASRLRRWVIRPSCSSKVPGA